MGRAVGYLVLLTIARFAIAAWETRDGREPKVVIVSNAGRRFEIRTDQLRGAGLPNCFVGSVARSSVAEP